MWHYLCFQKYPKNTIKMGKKQWKNLDQFLTLDLDQFLTLETPNLGPVLTLQHIMLPVYFTKAAHSLYCKLRSSWAWPSAEPSVSLTLYEPCARPCLCFATDDVHCWKYSKWHGWKHAWRSPLRACRLTDPRCMTQRGHSRNLEHECLRVYPWLAWAHMVLVTMDLTEQWCSGHRKSSGIWYFCTSGVLLSMPLSKAVASTVSSWRELFWSIGNIPTPMPSPTHLPAFPGRAQCQANPNQ